MMNNKIVLSSLFPEGGIYTQGFFATKLVETDFMMT